MIVYFAGLLARGVVDKEATICEQLCIWKLVHRYPDPWPHSHARVPLLLGVIALRERRNLMRCGAMATSQMSLRRRGKGRRRFGRRCAAVVTRHGCGDVLAA